MNYKQVAVLNAKGGEFIKRPRGLCWTPFIPTSKNTWEIAIDFML